MTALQTFKAVTEARRMIRDGAEFRAAIAAAAEHFHADVAKVAAFVGEAERARLIQELARATGASDAD